MGGAPLEHRGLLLFGKAGLVSEKGVGETMPRLLGRRRREGLHPDAALPGGGAAPQAPSPHLLPGSRELPRSCWKHSTYVNIGTLYA